MYMYMELMDLAVVLFICSFAELPHQINLWSLYLESGESHCADKLVKNRFPANTAFIIIFIIIFCFTSEAQQCSCTNMKRPMGPKKIYIKK